MSTYRRGAAIIDILAIMIAASFHSWPFVIGFAGWLMYDLVVGAVEALKTAEDRIR